ncbi:Dephospho-CoA kinase [Paraburkholderia domus]|jgi:dephospho-CoA kinase|uniref:Dephospho-CoA kinase n=1 Tax=Paraburkholderia domus TaxID=2793075 RepID=A0A9N8N702_9BURK|nr:dephospho-CoA kinase [Paraburkholderia domus]MBK5050746.1 dephospho-CoA kinase [Burkholderia sp. R-70006]MBK5059526.1 dephospho-CoA kinase [Burkholderia sp. R-70199]MBK5086867.1 dephospho-CoA kinase [Burkholderia sp. R-69927]MBK5119618.1 dephospho-CoA kinase [Burkholderia sp. R-69980]MBK5167667.1 dephospho-CoA kinase [Burkholderia sp. R-70211]MBK5183183.1 dephospho-CoA kinase [Burkholderia sp. R-69749]MCI0150550.1 dephospho-CoA kinase [Paraburkholderia sediminicola]
MFAVGLTGGIGSGKSTVAELFAAHGVPLVDTDLIAHRITAPHGIAMPQIAAEFGDSFVAADGSLDRARMRTLVFSDDGARKRLEGITHPLIRAETEREQREAQGPYVIVVVPLLVESGSWKTRVNRVLTVDCSVETQISRVMSRNGFSREQVLAIIARQATREARLAAADDVIDNDNAPFGALKAQVDAQHRVYLSLAGA